MRRIPRVAAAVTVAAVLAGSGVLALTGAAAAVHPGAAAGPAAGVGPAGGVGMAAVSRTPAKGRKKPPPGPFPGMTPAKIRLAEALAALAAKTVHVQGTVLMGTKHYSVDLHVGADTRGTIFFDHGSMAVLRVGTALYLSADDALFTANGRPELVPAFHGKWISIVPQDPAYAEIVPLTYLKTWARLAGGVPATVRAPGITLRGVPTVAISGATGYSANTLYVAAKGTPYPLFAKGINPVDRITFFDWNAPVTATAPAPELLVDEPDDTVIDLPEFPSQAALAFRKLWPVAAPPTLSSSVASGWS